MFENYEIMLFQPRQIAHSQRSVRCLHRLSVGGCEKSRFVSDEMRMQTWRWTELLQMIEVTARAIPTQ